MRHDWKIALLMVVIVACIAIAGCATTPPSGTPTPTPTSGGGGVIPGSDWQMTNYGPTMSRNSPQTVIGKNNVANLEVKWILNTNYPIEAPALIVGDTAYVTDNACQVIAVDLATGISKWIFDPDVYYSGTLLPRASSTHGMTYENGIIYTPTGPNGTIVALNAQTGKKIWESAPIGTGPAFREPAPPLIWNNIIIAGSALGDEPPFGVAQKGSVTGLDKTTGKTLWTTPLAVGAWVTTSPNASQNGGATSWTGGAVDLDTGVAYLPVGNPSPDFQPDIRSPGPNKYSNSVIAVNFTDGKILWDTPFVAENSVLNISPSALPDGHDWDCSWGTNLATVDMGTGPQKVVIGHSKRGDVIAMNATTGTPIWWTNVIYTQNVDQNPTPTGTDTVWPGPGAGCEAFTATDGMYVYVAASSTPKQYFSQQPSFLKGTGLLLDGGAIPVFSAIPNGFGNGTITALDIKTGKVVWQYKSPNPTFVSPLISNGVLYSGRITDTGTPYEYSDFGGPTKTPQVVSGILYAFDANTGQMLWQFNLGAQAGIGGPSIGNGYLLVGTGGIQTPNQGGYMIAFGLP
jgi:alcohol dehydrogenase (cytochrome c)